jgi:hypothetical protein
MADSCEKNWLPINCLGRAVSKQDQGAPKQLISMNLVCSKFMRLSNEFFSFLPGKNLLHSIKKRNDLSNHLLSYYSLSIEQIKIKLILSIADLKGAS